MGKRAAQAPQAARDHGRVYPAAPELIWGIHPVLELLRHRPHALHEIMIQDSRSGGKLEEIAVLAGRLGIKLQLVSSLKVPGLPGNATHQGVAARLIPQSLISLDELLSRAGTSPNPLLLALDHIQDPRNLGAIIRSAAAAGVDGIILTRDRSAPLSGSAAKAAAGALALVNICRVTNLAAALTRLKKAGLWIFGTDRAASSSIYQTEFSGPLCLVIGGEQKGMRRLIKDRCDFTVSIPMRPPLDSLNAAAAAAVTLFEIVRQRAAAG